MISILHQPPLVGSVMEFSTVGAEDSLDEARKRLEEVECLVVFGSKDTIVGVITEVEINRNGNNCGSIMELDTLVVTELDNSKVAIWKPIYIVIHDGEYEPLSVSRGP